MKRTLLLLLLLLPSFVSADATLFVSPERGSYATGEVFQVRILADTGGQSINAAEAELDFDPRALSVLSISTTGSILSTWSTQPRFSNSKGTIEFSGWADQTYAGRNGLLVTVTFKALQGMSGNARFAAGAILAADGQGSNIISDMKSATFTIRSAAPADSVPVVAAKSPQGMPSMPVEYPPTAEPVRAPEGHVRPDAPSLSEYPRSVSIGERLIIKGTADPNAPVRVYVQYSDYEPDEGKVMTAADGSFVYASEEIRRPGIYYVWTQQDRGSTESEPSRRVKIEAKASGFTASVKNASELVEASIPFLVILAFFGLAIGYFLHRDSHPRYPSNHIG